MLDLLRNDFEDIAIRWRRALVVDVVQVLREFFMGEWMSPLVTQFVLDAYASGTYGANWKTPSEVDITIFKAGEVHAAGAPLDPR